MRILAIRGRNIASLAGEFEVDFRTEPLASAGLFAICGPTGSGKSTLLDVLCLALYDRTPRLEKATGHGVNLPDVGDHTVSPQDPRNLLRRGTGEGYAEVEFAGNDGEEYRARWSVRRAHGRVDRRLQASEVSLLHLTDNQAIGSLKTEVLPEIQRRLGLDFAQFTRAVLLAQNEFTAFLQADDNDRAALLEQLTGTDIYTVLSCRAFERGRAEQQALDDLGRRLGDCQPLDAAARASLEDEAREARKTAGNLDKDAQALDRQLRWHADLDAARRAEDEARVTQAKAARSLDEAADRRAHLARVESVQPAAARVTEYDRTANDLRASREEAMPRAEQEAADAAAHVSKAEADRKAAKVAVAKAEEQLRQAQPHLQHARELDLQASGLEDQRVASVAERDRIARVDGDAQFVLATARSQHESLVAERQHASKWLEQHEDRRKLAEDWSRWDTLFAQAANAESQAAASGRRLDEAHRTALDERQRLEQAAGTRREAQEGLEYARRVFEAAEAALAKLDVGSVAAERNDAFARRDALATAQQLDGRQEELRARRAELDRAAEAEADRAAAAARAAGEVEARRTEAEAARQRAERAEEEARQACARSVEKLRVTLEPGRPCPVCGATAHPYASAEHGFDSQALRVLKRQLKECRERVEALAMEAGEQRTTAAEAARRKAEIERDLQIVLAGEEEAQRLWHADPLAAETAKLSDADRASWFAEHLAAVDRRLREFTVLESAARDAAAARDRARSAVDEASQAVHEATRLESDAKSRAQQARSLTDASRDALLRSEEQREALLGELDAAFSDLEWRAEWRADPQPFRVRQEQRATEYRSHQESARAAADRLGRLDVEIDGLANAAGKTAGDLQRASGAVQGLVDQLAEKREARARLFEGRSVADVQQEIEAAVQSSRSSAESCDHHVADARSKQSAADSRLEAARRLLDDRQQAADAARTALDEWLATYNGARPAEPTLEVDALRQLLTHDASWVAGERQQLHVLDVGLAKAQSVLKDREARRETIEREHLTDETLGVVRARRDDVGAALEVARTTSIRAETQIGQDDDRRRKVQDLGAGIERQQQVAALWAQMSDLIGSADGKKFRNYAQQLTLDILLEFANRHLSDLARRYRLQRLADKLALIVVDRDMADEVRSVYSLSGGESFLVSLALALGLASLSANRVRVESLFIDEGFGALDADTLSVAMDALDRLHAQGRKVGVISHVQEMAERIGTQVRVERQSGGRSRVLVAG